MRKKLPIGIQTFPKIIEDGCCYVDKTAMIKQALKRYDYASAHQLAMRFVAGIAAGKWLA